MTLDPKHVAKIIRGFIKSGEERRHEAEARQAVQIKMTKNRLRRHVNTQKEMCMRLKGLAKQALSINDEAAFKKVARQYLWTQNDIRRWERYLLSLEMLEARHDQARASVELLNAIKTMSESLSDLAGPEKLGDLQVELERGLAKASTLEEKMAAMMDVMDSTLASDSPAGEQDMQGLEGAFSDELAAEEAAAFDPQVDQLRQRITKEMQKP